MLNTYITDLRREFRITFKNNSTCARRRKTFINVEPTFDVDGVLVGSEKARYVSLRRARVAVVDYALCNDFSYFGTITINSAWHDVTNAPAIAKSVLNLFKYIRDKYAHSFKYLLVPEFGTKTNRLHFHFLFENLPQALLRLNEHGFLDVPLISSKIGFVQISAIKNTEQDKANVAKYCSKYVTKNNVKILNHRYFCSRGLKKPQKTRLNYYLTTFIRPLVERIATCYTSNKYGRSYKCTLYDFSNVLKNALCTSVNLFRRGMWLYNAGTALDSPFP